MMLRALTKSICWLQKFISPRSPNGLTERFIAKTEGRKNRAVVALDNSEGDGEPSPHYITVKSFNLRKKAEKQGF